LCHRYGEVVRFPGGLFSDRLVGTVGDGIAETLWREDVTREHVRKQRENGFKQTDRTAISDLTAVARPRFGLTPATWAGGGWERERESWNRGEAAATGNSPGDQRLRPALVVRDSKQQSNNQSNNQTNHHSKYHTHTEIHSNTANRRRNSHDAEKPGRNNTHGETYGRH